MPFFLCFRAQNFETTEVLDGCRAFASAQKTSQNIEKTPIPEKSAD